MKKFIGKILFLSLIFVLPLSAMEKRPKEDGKLKQFFKPILSGMFEKVKLGLNQVLGKCKEVILKGGKILFCTKEGLVFLVILISIGVHYYLVISPQNGDCGAVDRGFCRAFDPDNDMHIDWIRWTKGVIEKNDLVPNATYCFGGIPPELAKFLELQDFNQS